MAAWRTGITADGRTFYINDADRTTSWDRPGAAPDYPSAAAAGGAPLPRGARCCCTAVLSPVKLGDSVRKVRSVLLIYCESLLLASAITTPRLSVLRVAACLPVSGWRTGRTAEGRAYYINDADRTTSWHRPRALETTSSSAAAAAGASAPLPRGACRPEHQIYRERTSTTKQYSSNSNNTSPGMF